MNVGQLAKRDSQPFFVACTPKGIMELLKAYDVELKGKKAVVVGRSNIVVSDIFMVKLMTLMVGNACFTFITRTGCYSDCMSFEN